VQECLRRCREAGVVGPLPAEFDELTIHARLYRRSVPLSRTPHQESRPGSGAQTSLVTRRHTAHSRIEPRDHEHAGLVCRLGELLT
jgi:hypothetical protein